MVFQGRAAASRRMLVCSEPTCGWRVSVSAGGEAVWLSYGFRSRPVEI